MTASDSSDNLKNNDAATAAPAPAAPKSAEGSNVAPEAAPKEEPKAGPTLEQQLDEAKKTAAKNHDHYVRAMADLENFRRRAVREKDELRQFAAGRVLEDLLPVLDNLALGIAAAKAPNADVKTLVGGIDMVLGQLKASLAGHGLKEINPLGEKFDPNQHESISSQPSPEIPEGSVFQVVRTGYSLNGRLLRPASVILSSGPQKA
ncbi:MAG: nucleotide exchange factor GrpE [Nibricoccus sp.]